MKKKKKVILIAILLLLCLGASCAGIVYYYLFVPPFKLGKTVYVYVDRDDTQDSVCHKLTQTTGSSDGLSLDGPL